MTSSPTRRIGVVTVGRSDYSILTPILKQMEADPEIDLRLYVTGQHLTDLTMFAFPVAARVPMTLATDDPESIALNIGLGVIGFAHVFEVERPDILVIMGDRYEMLAAVMASRPFGIHIAHIHGGESTEGAMDEGIRHMITMLASSHFPATEFYAGRIRQMADAVGRA